MTPTTATTDAMAAPSKKERVSLGSRVAQVLGKRYQEVRPRATVIIDRYIRRDPEKLNDSEMIELVDAIDLLDIRSLCLRWSRLKTEKLIESVRDKVLGIDRTRERILAIATTPEGVDGDIQALEAKRQAAEAELSAAKHRLSEVEAEIVAKNEDRRLRRELVKRYNKDRVAFPGLPFEEVE